MVYVKVILIKNTLLFPFLIFSKNTCNFLYILLKIEKWCEDNLNCLIRYTNKTKKIQSKEKYEKLYKKNIHYKKIIDISKYDPTIQMKLSDKVEFFDNDIIQLVNKISNQKQIVKCCCFIQQVFGLIKTLKHLEFVYIVIY